MDFRPYLRLVVLLSTLQMLVITIFHPSQCFHCDDERDWMEEGHSAKLLLNEFVAASHSSTLSSVDPKINPAENSSVEAVPSATLSRKKEARSRVQGLSSIKMGSTQIVSQVSPPDLAAAEGLQADDETLILVGGYIDNYRNVSTGIQFFNITSQEWRTKDNIQLPESLAETHQGIAFDKENDMLYIVSGQKGSGCMPATSASGRINVKTGRFEELPSLPEPRYAPGMELVTDPSDPTIKHLHVFGGACRTRNQTASDHWRLVITDTSDLANSTWEVLESVPDAGTHGTSFLFDGYIYYTGFCTLDPGMVPSPSMAECHLHAREHSQQLLHHVSDAGFMFRYPTDFVPALQGQTIEYGWERLEDMPFPVCHGGSVSVHEKLFVVGGAVATVQTKRGSAPSNFPIVQTYDAISNSWSVAKFDAPKRTPLFLLSTWIDSARSKLYSLHSGRSLVVGDVVVDKVSTKEVDRLNEIEFSDFQTSFMYYTRSLAIGAFQNCIEGAMGLVGRGMMKTLFDSHYDDSRRTWNLRMSHVQFPDILIFPDTVQQIQSIVQCGKRTGYHICARNGRHSYDGTTCTHGIVVDVSKLDSVDIVSIEDGVVRLGAGLTLGQVALRLDPYGLTLPMGSCSSVGVTGLVLNGGQGPLTRMYGLTSDRLQSIEVVDSNGLLLNATVDNQYSDYLWLARGGGSVDHYPGIITGLQFRGLPNVPQNATIWTRVKLCYRSTVSNAVKLLAAWQDFFADLEPNDPFLKRITAEPWVFMRFRRQRRIHEPALYMVVYFFGNDDLHKRFMEHYLPAFEGMGGGAKARSVERLNELGFHRLVGGVRSNADLANSSAGFDLNTVWQGYSAVALEEVPESVFQRVVETVYIDQPIYRRYAEFKPLGAAVRDRQTEHAAFWHRGARWWVLVNHFLKPGDPDVTGSLLRNSLRHSELIDAMGTSFGGEYAGYVQHSNSIMRDLRRYYGDNAVRIQTIKRARDPHNLYRHYLPSTPRKLPIVINSSSAT
eukprot:scaffold3043_cov121-Cylindrotheca_fusiformis.AAC.6